MKINKLIKVIPALIAGLVLTSEGAPIAWTVGTVTDLNDVSTNGTLVEAFNAAGTGALTDPIVNTVTFTGTDALMTGNVDATVFASGDTGSASYNTLLSTLDFGTDANISVGGDTLVIGQDYEIQIWYNQTNAIDRFMDYGDGETPESTIKVNGNVENVLNSPQAFGQYAIGTFTADGTSQTITTTPDGMPSGQFNAYQLRAISKSTDEFRITDFSIDSATNEITLEWNAEPTQIYTIYYTDTLNNLQKLGDLGDDFRDNVGADTDLTDAKISVTIPHPDTEASELYFSVHKN